ncbi:MAG: hypothetical protein KJ058_13055 [Thermoanaerobaculia bacterium]|nr:hypothetical protein [Thermoanaerobaculia bacterium]MCZ7650448.1 hypothetical protein [Thermoanaerobaculia bacterium]
MQSLLVVLDPGPATGAPLAPRLADQIAGRIAGERPDLRMAHAAGAAPALLAELARAAAVIFLDAREGDGPASVAVEMLRADAEPPGPPEALLSRVAAPEALLRQAAALGSAPARAASVTLLRGAGENPPPPEAGGDDDAVALAVRCVLRLLEEWELELA